MTTPQQARTRAVRIATPRDPGPRQPYPGQQPGQPPHSGGQQPPTYPGAAAAVAPAQPKPWFKKWWVWLLIVIGVFAVAGALGGGGDAADQATQTTASSEPEPEPSEEPKADLTLDDGWEKTSDDFAVYITGYVSNNTDKP
ncbi:MAG: hypothetical protein ACK5LS_11400, partial [Propioniciclava sp.]